MMRENGLGIDEVRALGHRVIGSPRAARRRTYKAEVGPVSTQDHVKPALLSFPSVLVVRICGSLKPRF